MPTVPLAAEAIGCKSTQIIKTVVFADARPSPGRSRSPMGSGAVDRRSSWPMQLSAASLNWPIPVFVLERDRLSGRRCVPIGSHPHCRLAMIDIAVLDQEIGLRRRRD